MEHRLAAIFAADMVGYSRLMGADATLANENPIVIGFITAISSAFAYLTVIGTPASTIVFAAGYLRPADFLKVGSRMVVVSTIVLLLVASLYWPLIGA